MCWTDEGKGPYFKMRLYKGNPWKGSELITLATDDLRIYGADTSFDKVQPSSKKITMSRYHSLQVFLTRVSQLAVLTAIVLISPLNTYGKQIPQWRVFEIVLHARSNYSQAFPENKVTAVFRGPGKMEKKVQGFWDGGNTFRIRFTPTVQGKWSYRTYSDDEGLTDKNGEFTCVKPPAGVHGFRRRDKRHPYHFIYDDGTHYLLFGTTYYAIISNAKGHGSWKEAINGIGEAGINKVRFRTCFIHGDRQGSNYPSSSPYGETHDQLNTDHFRIIDTIVEYLFQRGITADLILFSSGSRNFGTLSQDERYVRYMIHRYAAYPNVVWCLSNEWNYTGKNRSYWNKMGRIISKEDPWMNNKDNLRMLSTHQQTRIDFQFFDVAWPTFACIQYGVRNKGYKETDENEWKPSGGTKYHHGDEWGNEGILFNLGHDMPVVNDEYGYAGEPDDESVRDGTQLTRTKHRQIIWGIYTAGGYGSTGDKYFYRDPPGRPYYSADWHYIAEYGDIKRLIDFFKQVPYWEMRSHNDIVTSKGRAYVLANPGEQYVIYVATGGNFSLDLPAGDFVATLYNPRTGSKKFIKNIAGPGKSFLATPENNDWVVQIKKQRH